MQIEIGFPGGARVDASFDHFTVPTDQPVRNGGDDSAPAPFDYFLASIGTCAGVYVLNFLESRKLPTSEVRVVLTTEKDPARKRISTIRINVQLPEGFPEKYRNAVRHSVDLCSVKKHILDPPKFETTIEIAGAPIREPQTAEIRAV